MRPKNLSVSDGVTTIQETLYHGPHLFLPHRGGPYARSVHRLLDRLISRDGSGPRPPDTVDGEKEKKEPTAGGTRRWCANTTKLGAVLISKRSCSGQTLLSALSDLHFRPPWNC